MTGDGAFITEGEFCCGEVNFWGDCTCGGLAILNGEATFGGEYVLGEARVAGERNPVGDAIEGKGIAERAETFTDGVPATCSGSALKSRGTADGSKTGANVC